MIDMKSEDFERLKAVCEKEGFEVGIDPFFNHLFKVKKKDIWDGVEFAKGPTGHIYRLDQLKANFDRKAFKPSTESAYIEQLKKEAFDRFGEIKEGDRFELPFGGIIHQVRGSKETFTYEKEFDWFFYRQVKLYEKGKWATRVKERVKVPCHVIEYLRKYINTELSYIQIEHLEGNGTKAKAEFLAQQLEKYLNEEL